MSLPLAPTPNRSRSQWLQLVLPQPPKTSHGISRSLECPAGPWDNGLLLDRGGPSRLWLSGSLERDGPHLRTQLFIYLRFSTPYSTAREANEDVSFQFFHRTRHFLHGHPCGPVLKDSSRSSVGSPLGSGRYLVISGLADGDATSRETEGQNWRTLPSGR